MNKILVQWASEIPQDYEEITLGQWQGLPYRPVPRGGEHLSPRGYIRDVIVDGVSFAGFDHVSVEPASSGAIQVTGWNDDPEDHATPQAFVWRFFPHRADNRFGRSNTYQLLTIFADEWDRLQNLATTGGMVELRAWGDFVPPSEAVTRHGIWLSDELHAAHLRAARSVSWREWE